MSDPVEDFVKVHKALFPVGGMIVAGGGALPSLWRHDLEALIERANSASPVSAPPVSPPVVPTAPTTDLHVERPMVLAKKQTYCACGSPWPCALTAPVVPEGAQTEGAL